MLTHSVISPMGQALSRHASNLSLKQSMKTFTPLFLPVFETYILFLTGILLYQDCHIPGVETSMSEVMLHVMDSPVPISWVE